MDELNSQDREAIDALFKDMYQAWTEGDARRYAACFEPDVDYVAFDGTHIKGRADNERLHRLLFEGVLRGTRLEGGLVQLRPLTSDVVLAHATGAVAFPWQREHKKSRFSIQTLVLMKREGRWLAAAFQNTRVKPMPAPEKDSLTVRAFSAYAALRRALAPSNGYSHGQSPAPHPPNARSDGWHCACAEHWGGDVATTCRTSPQCGLKQCLGSCDCTVEGSDVRRAVDQGLGIRGARPDIAQAAGHCGDQPAADRASSVE